jgi:hypothetical protein
MREGRVSALHNHTRKAITGIRAAATTTTTTTPPPPPPPPTTTTTTTTPAPSSRRDLGVLYLHAGLFAEAGAELSEYLRRASARRSYSAGEEAEGAFDPFDLRLTRLLVELAASGGEAPRGEAPAAGGGPAEGPRRQTLLAPGAGGAAPKAAAVLDAAPERARGGGGGDGDGPARLMSVEKVLGAAASTDGGPGAAGGLLGAARGKLPLTW